MNLEEKSKMLKTKTLSFNLENKKGPFKILNATNGGPIYKRHTQDQLRSNFTAYKEARMPYQRNHDSGSMHIYGGPYSHDITKIFPNFDADENLPESYDFACTDEAILACLDTGTKTFFRLGETIEHQIVKHDVHPPRDFNKWARICEHIIMHYTEGWADGYELDMPYWEIWCEPDLGPQLWTGTKEQFFDLYEITAKLLKSRFPHLKIGGPGMTGGSKNFAWADAFLSEMQKREVPMDFFSWHRYTKTPEDTLERATRIQAMLDKYGYGNAEHIISEWGYVRDWVENFQYSINATHKEKGAAFMMATISMAQRSEMIDMLMYYGTFPSVFNAVFDYYSLERLKGYYALAWYGQNYYDLESYIPCLDEKDDLYTLCGIDKNGKITCIVTHYSENDDTVQKKIKLDFGRKAKFEVYAVDKNHNGELIKVTSRTTFKMPVHSFILLKEI